jgi:hypothetical protein
MYTWPHYPRPLSTVAMLMLLRTPPWLSCPKQASAPVGAECACACACILHASPCTCTRLRILQEALTLLPVGQRAPHFSRPARPA